MEFGEWLRVRRRELDLTQEEAASRAGITRAMWQKLEAGQSLPGKKSVPGIASALSFDVKEVYDRFLPGVTEETNKEVERFATRLRAALAVKQMTGTDLADQLGLAKQSVDQWARGICFPRLDKLAAIAAALGCSTDWLLGNDDAAAPDLAGRTIQHASDDRMAQMLCFLEQRFDALEDRLGKFKGSSPRANRPVGEGQLVLSRSA